MSIERCGFCGRYFNDNYYLTQEDIENTAAKLLEEAPLGYCPNAQAEDAEQNPEQYRRVTRDMAIDAGDPDLEGQLL